MRECDSCPWRLWPVRCYAARVGSVRLCQLRRDRADYARIVEAKTLKPDVPPAPPSVPPPPPSPWLLARRAAVACPDRRGPSCGCGGWECAREGKAGPTDLARCAACLGIELPGAIQTG